MKNALGKNFLVLASASLCAVSFASAASLTWNGGDGTWDTVTSNWTDGSPATWPSASTGGDTATFGGAAGNVSLSGNITANALNFDTTGYTLSGGKLTLDGATPTITTGSGVTATISSIVAGSAGLTNAGSGTLVLSGANTYTGVTTVNSGTLKLDLSTRTGGYGIGINVVNASGVLELYNTNTAADGTLFSNTTFSGAGTLRKTGAGYIDATFTGSNINAFDGLIDVQEGTLGFNNGTQGSGRATLQIANGATVDIRTGTLQVDALNDVGGSGGAVSVSWSNGGTLSVGNNSGSGSFAGTLANGVSSLTLIKNGTGTQTLTGANTYTGATTINGGVLQIGGAGTLGGGFYGGALTLGPDGTFRYSSSANQTLSGVITGSGDILKDGTGVLTLSGSSTNYNGTVTVNAGTLAGTGTLGSGGTLVLGSGASILGAAGTGDGVAGNVLTVGNVTTTGAGGIIVLGALSSSGVVDILNYTGSWTGAPGDFDLSNYRTPSAVTSVTVGAGKKLQFTAGLSQIDTWNVASGTWDNSHAADVWSNGLDGKYYAGDTVRFNDVGSLTSASVTLSGSLTPESVTFDNATTAYTIGGTGTIAGDVVKGGTGTVTFTASNPYTGNTTVNAGTLQIGGTGTLGGGSYGGALSLASGGTFRYSSSANQTISGAIGGTGTILKDTAGSTLTLSGNMSSFGGSVIAAAGTLAVTTGLKNTTGATIGANGSSGATLRFSSEQTLASLTVAAGSSGSTLDFNPGGATFTATVSGATTLNSGLFITQSNTTGVGWGQFTVSGITGAGAGAGNDSLTISNTAGNQLYFTAQAGTYDFLGNVHINGTNAILLQGGNFLPTTASVIIDKTASLRQNAGYTATYTFDGLMDGAGGGGTWSTGGAQTLSMGNNNGSASFSGSIQGNTTVVKNGMGMQTFAGANTYTGTTTVSGGTLVTGNVAALGTGSVSVNAAGAVLQIGDGVVNTVTLGSGANLAIADGAILKLGALNVASLDGAEGVITLDGGTYTFNTSGKLDLNAVLDGVDAGSHTYTLISGTAADGGELLLAGITGYDTSRITLDSFAAGTLTFTAVPEPSTYGLLGAGALAGVAFIRRRRRRNA